MRRLRHPAANQRGLTLLELLVVLTILVVLSTVAITSTSGVADQARYEATQRTLENVRDAVLGPSNARDSFGTLQVSGFLADVGRLPQATQEAVDGGNIFTLRELLENVNGLAPHAVLQATSANLTSSVNVTLTAFEDPEVFLASGWRGPYLRLPPGDSTLRDGWAAELASPEGVVSGHPNALLRMQDGNDITAVNQPVGAIWSLGANSTENAADTGYDRDLSVTFPTAQTEASVFVTVVVQNTDGTTATVAEGDQVFVYLFAPDPATGLISVTGLNPVAPTAPASSLSFNFSTNWTPGARVIRAYYDTDDDSVIEALEPKSLVTPVTLRAGGNTFVIVLNPPS